MMTTWLTGCQPTQPPPLATSATIAASAPASSATAATSSAPGAGSAAACTRFDAAHRASLARLRDGAPAEVARTLDSLPAIIGRCVPDPGGTGAWGLQVEELCATPAPLVPWVEDRPTVIGSWKVVRVDGERVASYPQVNPPPDPQICAADPNLDHLGGVSLAGTPEQIAALKFEEPVVFDHDGDDRAELMLRVQRQRVSYDMHSQKLERSIDNRGSLLTVEADGRVTDFVGARFISASAAAVWFQGAANIDDDGRPDAYTLFPYADSGPVEWDGKAPRLYARALPGGRFSIDDPRAIAKTLAACPPATEPVVVPATGAVDGDATLARAICIALRSGAEEARAALDRGCKGRDPAACTSARAMAKLFEQSVPRLEAPRTEEIRPRGR